MHKIISTYGSLPLFLLGFYLTSAAWADETGNVVDKSNSPEMGSFSNPAGGRSQGTPMRDKSTGYVGPAIGQAGTPGGGGGMSSTPSDQRDYEQGTTPQDTNLSRGTRLSKTFSPRQGVPQDSTIVSHGANIAKDKD